MAHFDLAVIRDTDGNQNVRLEAALRDFQFPDEHDLIAVPNGTNDICDGDAGLFRSVEDVAIKLHGVTRILLVRHTACGAVTPPYRLRLIEKELEAARDALTRQFGARLEVKTMLLRLDQEMPTQNECAVIRCMDGRLNRPLRQYLRGIRFPETHDLISVPGGPKDIIDGEQGLFRLVDDVRLMLPRAKRLLLVQHTDCGAYGGRAKCGGTEAADREFQISQVRQARAELRKRVGNQLEVQTIVAHLRDSGLVRFVKFNE